MFNTNVLHIVSMLLYVSRYSDESTFVVECSELEDYSHDLVSTSVIVETSTVPEDFTTELQNVLLCETADQWDACEAFLETHIKKNSEVYRQLQTFKDSSKLLRSFSYPLPYVAAFKGYTKLIQVLLRNGLPINKKYTLMEETVLHVAAERGHEDLVIFLLDLGADIQVKDWSGNTPLHVAVHLYKTTIVKLLLDAGADVNVKNKLSETPIFHAVKYLNQSKYRVFKRKEEDEAIKRRFVAGKDIIEMLLEHEADTNITDYRGKTPLHVAAKKCNLTIVQLLKDRGANINATDKRNQTPLYDAVLSNNLPVVEYLVAIDADKTVIDRNKKTALDIAKENNFTEIVDLLSGES